MREMKNLKIIFAKPKLTDEMAAHCEREKDKANKKLFQYLAPFVMLAMTGVALVYAIALLKTGFDVKNMLYVVLDLVFVAFVFLCFVVLKVHKPKQEEKFRISALYFITMIWVTAISVLDGNVVPYIIALLLFSTVFIIEMKPLIITQAVAMVFAIVSFALLGLDEATLLAIYINMFFGHSVGIFMSRVRYNINIERFADKKIIEEQNVRLKEMAETDGLTGVYNRRFFDENLKRVMKTLCRSKCSLCLMLVDIDYFKNYNDTYGHGEGDECLKKVAKAIADAAKREDDFVARYGGEEFAVVLPNTDGVAARIIAERIIENIRALNVLHENSEAADCVTVSIGGVFQDASVNSNVAEYIKRADDALYESKRNGRNRYTLSSL